MALHPKSLPAPDKPALPDASRKAWTRQAPAGLSRTAPSAVLGSGDLWGSSPMEQLGGLGS